MKIAIISDIHGNMEALEAVLADMEETEPDRIYCLGDTIGYGPEPEEAVSTLREKNIPSVCGNHELVIQDNTHLGWFNPVARASLLATMGMLSAQTKEYIRTLPMYLLVEDAFDKTDALDRNIRLVHGFPPDSATTYLFQAQGKPMRKYFAGTEDFICFIGHTHDLSCYSYDGTQVKKLPFARGMHQLENKMKYIINIGSVGQPRDMNNNAKYVLLDTKTFCLELRFVPYEIQAVVDKIMAKGLPEVHAERLW